MNNLHQLLKEAYNRLNEYVVMHPEHDTDELIERILTHQPTPAAAPLPNDLSHLSEEQFHDLCPQGYHGVGDDGSAVPEGREPAAVTSEPSVEQPAAEALTLTSKGLKN